nr:MAG TPA: hypothetical protein [Caudoviricetes sp.]
MTCHICSIKSQPNPLAFFIWSGFRPYTSLTISPQPARRGRRITEFSRSA